MFLGKLFTNLKTLTGIVNNAALFSPKAIDCLPPIVSDFNQLWKRFIVTERESDLALDPLSTKKRDNKPKVISEDVNEHVRNMPPKKQLKLASKLKNLTNSSENVSNFETTEDESPPKSKLRLRNLRVKKTPEIKDVEESKPAKTSKKGSLKAIVDLEMMKSELKQLEDPPTTEEDKLLSANRLGFDFFNVECKTLAKNLLGKILVRKLENGTILKGKIVETESYLGGEDKASQTYQYKVTPRTLPMYMPPGTIYVYLTYGMYHCLNISSAVPGASVFIRALEPLVGKSYMELLRNMQLKRGSKNAEMTKKLKVSKSHELCNGPSKLCTALEIDKENFNQRDITKCSNLWIEHDNTEIEKNSFIIVAAPRIGIQSAGTEWAAKPLRFYIFENESVSEGSVVLIRALSPIEGMDKMAELRNSKPTENSKSRSVRSFKDHELSNGPSKFCMAFNMNRNHSKYSVCSWKGMWVEDDTENEDFHIIECPRIGIDSAGPEWALKPMRYYIFGNQSVSKKDKKAELALTNDKK